MHLPFMKWLLRFHLVEWIISKMLDAYLSRLKFKQEAGLRAFPKEWASYSEYKKLFRVTSFLFLWFITIIIGHLVFYLLVYLEVIKIIPWSPFPWDIN